MFLLSTANKVIGVGAMNNLVIRECKRDDIDSILELQKEWTAEDITFGFTPADKDYLNSKLGSYFFVAEQEREIVGFVYGTVHEATDLAVMCDGQKYIEVDDIYIKGEMRSKNIGSALIEKLLQTANENGIERSLVYSATKDIDKVMKFYKKHGFKPWFVQMYR